MPRPKSPLAGKTIKIKSGEFAGLEITIEDWWKNLSGKSWMASFPQPAAVVQHAARVQRDNLPRDDDVVYGHIAGLGYLVHISELEGGERFAFTG